MKPFFLMCSIFCTLLGSVEAGDGVCVRCQKIREENAKKPPPEHKYYEDYLKAEKTKENHSSMQNENEIETRKN